MLEAKDLIAKSTITIHAPATQVWDALVNPEKIRKYMFGTAVESAWKEGSSILWKGEWQGKKYEDKGKILQFKPTSFLQYTHFSPLSGQEDTPENYHTVTIQLTEAGENTNVTLTQDHNPNKEAQQHSEQNWNSMLASLKKIVEETT